MSTATRILWRSAGTPLRSGVESHAAVCWWCGLSSLQSAPRSLVPDTFPDRPLARAKGSDWICAACAWTLCETVAIPEAQGRARIANLAAQGRRAQVRVRGGSAARYLILRLADDRIGLWQAGESAKKEEEWKAAIAELRQNPIPLPGIPFLESVVLTDLAPDATEKFRSYHHFGGAVLPWEVATDSDKARIKAILLSPPAGPYAAVIGDGQKHAAIYAEPGFGPVDCCVYFRPAHRNLRYVPAELDGLILAIEQLCVAGADDTEILSGRYQRPSPLLPRALATAEPVVARWRGGAFIDLALYLRRPRPVLLEDTTLGLCPPPTPIGSDRSRDRRPSEPALDPLLPRSPTLAESLPTERDPRTLPAPDRHDRPASGSKPVQLGLFGSGGPG